MMKSAHMTQQVQKNGQLGKSKAESEKLAISENKSEKSEVKPDVEAKKEEKSEKPESAQK